MVPMVQRRQDRHVVGLEHIETGGEDVCQLAFVYEDGGLSFTNRQLGAVLDLMPLTLKAPDHGVAGVVHPVNDVDEFAGQKIENTHGIRSPFGVSKGDPLFRGP